MFLLSGLGAVAVAFVVLGAGWLLSVARLQDMKTRLFTDAQSLENSYRLELAVRSVRSGGTKYTAARRAAAEREAAEREAAEREADSLAALVPASVTSPEETALVQGVVADYRRWREGGGPGTTEALLSSISAHRALNEQQMQATMRDGARLESNLRIISPLLIGLAALALGLGGFKLWRKIFQPILRLSHAAEEFGKGALWARAPVLCDDEMGDLCRTFNGMADAIRDREQERLHFVATVAHDLKNPLTVIGMAASMMRKKQLPRDQHDDWLGRIMRNTRELEGIITDLTDGVQAQTGQLELRREELDLAELAASVVRDQSAVLLQDRDGAARHHILRFEGEAVCPILGDRRRLERVLVNLLSNAVKYSPAGSEVRVTLWRHGAGVRLTVEDQGAGIAPEDVKRLFQPFTRLAGTRHMASGTGLGLVSVQKIIAAHGGQLDVFSRPGHGTSIEIFLKAKPGELLSDKKEPT